MNEKLEKVIKLLEKEINGTITIKDGMPIVFEFQLPRIGIVNIAPDPVLIEKRGAEMIALGVKMELQNFVHFLVFKEG